MNLRIEIPGPPKGKGRHRTARIGNFVRQYPDQKTEVYENLVKLCAQQAMKEANQPMFIGALRMDVTAIFPIPASWSGKKRNQAEEGIIRPTVKPDADNVLKICGDGLNGILYADDRAIVESRVSKIYGEPPRVIVEISQI